MQEKQNQYQNQNGSYYDVSEFGVPWQSSPQLRQLAEDYGVNYDDFMECLQCAMTPGEISSELGLDEKTAGKLTQIFLQHGLTSNLPMD